MVMNPRNLLVVASFTLAASSMSPATAADVAKPATAGQPSADAVLKQMSDTLAAAKQFSFKGTRQFSSAQAEGRNMQAKSDIEVTVRRPDHLTGTSTGDGNVRRMIFDGKNFTLLDGKTNMYSTVPMRASLDALPGQLAKKYGLVPPLADFVQSNPYKDLKRRSQSVTYLGTVACGTPATHCHRLGLSGKLADGELWIGVADHLPKKLTAKVKGGTDTGADLTIDFTDWNLAPAVTAETFVFTPPKDAQKIRMVTSAEIDAAWAKSAPTK